MTPIRALVVAAGPQHAVIDLGGPLLVVDPQALELEAADLVDLEIVDGRSYVVLEAPDLIDDSAKVVILEGCQGSPSIALRVPKGVSLPDLADLRLVRVALEVDEGFGPSARQLAADPSLPSPITGEPRRVFTAEIISPGAGI